MSYAGLFRNKKKVFICHNGCPRRSLDSSKLVAYFTINKCKVVKMAQIADYIVFVTCSFNQFKEDECWKLMEEYRRYKGELIVLGCLPEIAPDKFSRRFKGKYISTKNLDAIDRLFDGFNVKFKDVSDAHRISHRILPVFGGVYVPSFLSRLRRRLFVSGVTKEFIMDEVRRITNKEPAYLRISYGCVERCAYCSVYLAVGKLRSKSIEDCVKEYKDILRRGFRDIVILADNVGAYGLDIKSSFAELLRNLAVASQVEAGWYIQEIHPRWVTLYKDELLKLVREKKVRQILCPIQSGSNRILKLMNRHHSIEEIEGILMEFKEANPALRLYTHIIIGFPSETEEEFMESLNAIKGIGFNTVQFFSYQDRDGTAASKMDGKIDKAAIAERMRVAADLSRQEGIEVECF